MNAETIRQATSKHKMSVSEAQKILEIESSATLAEIREVSGGLAAPLAAPRRSL